MLTRETLENVARMGQEIARDSSSIGIEPPIKALEIYLKQVGIAVIETEKLNTLKGIITISSDITELTIPRQLSNDEKVELIVHMLGHIKLGHLSPQPSVWVERGLDDSLTEDNLRKEEEAENFCRQLLNRPGGIPGH